MPDELFISFWEKYGYKRGKKDAVAAWKKLSKKDKEEAIKAISVYKEDCRVCERQMRQPSVYLNKRTWEDDFTNNGKVSKEEQTEESCIVYPDGIDENQWTKITFWLCGCCHEIAGYISPTEFAEYKKRCKGDSKLLSEILKEINSYVELHGRIDISEKFDEFLKKHLDNEQETGD